MIHQLFRFAVMLMAAVQIALSSSNAAFTADRTTPRTGDIITLKLTVRAPEGAEITFPLFSSEWGSFEVISVENLPTAPDGTMAVYQQVLQVILWRPGDYQTPDTVVEIKMPDGQDVVIVVEPEFFSVPNVLDENDLFLRPFKAPLRIEEFPVAIVIAGIAAISLTILAMVSGFSHRISFRLQSNMRPLHPAAETALRQLQDIAIQSTDPAICIIQTADCLRAYVKMRFDVPAPDLTTRETSSALVPLPQLNSEQEQQFNQLLSRADWVKFSGGTPVEGNANSFNRQAQTWIRDIEVQAEKSE